jgi:hypothetical protein
MTQTCGHKNQQQYTSVKYVVPLTITKRPRGTWKASPNYECGYNRATVLQKCVETIHFTNISRQSHNALQRYMHFDLSNKMAPPSKRMASSNVTFPIITDTMSTLYTACTIYVTVNIRCKESYISLLCRHHAMSLSRRTIAIFKAIPKTHALFAHQISTLQPYLQLCIQTTVEISVR